MAILCILGASLVVFLFLQVAAGDPAEIAAGQYATPDVVQTMREKWGIDQPVTVQFTRFIGNMVRGDFGSSFRTGRPVISEVLYALPATLQLALLGMALSVVIGVPLGVISAARPGTFSDLLATMGALIGMSIPVFWVGIILILLFGYLIPFFPSSGWGSVEHKILPVLTIGLATTAHVARQTRSAVLEVLNEDYIRTARAKGLAERMLLYKHALRNALIPTLTVISLLTGQLLGGAVLTEVVFGIPGLGRLIVDAINARDLPVIRGGVMLIVTGFVLINLLTDVIYGVIDPRIRRS